MSADELAVKMRELTETAAPPMNVDIDRARRVGGRRRRVRTATVVIACAAMGVTGAVAVPMVLGSPSEMVPVASAPPEPPLRAKPTSMVAKAGFGWLPSVITGVEYGVGEHGDFTLAIGQGELKPMIWLSMYDREPPLDRRNDLGDNAVKVPVRVGGSDGYWVTANAGDPENGGDTYLRWRTADGRWAELHAYYLDVPDRAQALLRVAGEVKPGEHEVPLPVHISSLPPTFQLSDAKLSRRPDQVNGSPWAVQLTYQVDGAYVNIDVTPDGGPPPKSENPVCTTKNGLTGCVSVVEPGTDLSSVGGAQGLLDRLTFNGMDENTWTTPLVG